MLFNMLSDLQRYLGPMSTFFRPDLSAPNILIPTSLKSCPLPPALSCPLDPSISSCCTPSGGLFLQTQFWDPYPHAKGPDNSWTIHGLWPDNCDGSWSMYCDKPREYNNISAILEAYDGGAAHIVGAELKGRCSHEGSGKALLGDMQEYWKAGYGSDEHLWEHEWGKHGTCISTLNPPCYGDGYKGQEEVVTYFNTTVKLYETLPTYVWLAEAGITPSFTATYALKDVVGALQRKHDGLPIVRCGQKAELREVWYYFLLNGTVQHGSWVPTDPGMFLQSYGLVCLFARK